MTDVLGRKADDGVRPAWALMSCDTLSCLLYHPGHQLQGSNRSLPDKAVGDSGAMHGCERNGGKKRRDTVVFSTLFWTVFGAEETLASVTSALI